MNRYGEEPSYTLISCHFGDRFWIQNLVEKIHVHADPRIQEIVLIDQSRDSDSFLAALPGVSQVVSFKPDSAQIEAAGHDHPASLDRLLNSHIFRTSHIALFDSDAFPVSASWLDNVSDIVLAEVPGSNLELSHPAFMIFPVSAIPKITFSYGFLEMVDSTTRFRFDTGRMVAPLLRNAGYEVVMSPAISAFAGFRGHYYLDGQVYHHGHGSFLSGPQNLKLFISPHSERLWKRKISRGDMVLRPADFLFLGFTFFLRRLLNKIPNPLSKRT